MPAVSLPYATCLKHSVWSKITISLNSLDEIFKEGHNDTRTINGKISEVIQIILGIWDFFKNSISQQDRSIF